MFNQIKETIRNLNANVNDIANSQKAKELRHKLLTIGIVLMCVGGIGMLVCFTLFIVFSFQAGTDISAAIIVPFVLIIPFTLVLSIGVMLIQLGLKIIIVGASSQIINKSLSAVCPNCGDQIDDDEVYCNKCGLKLRQTCPSCGTVNDADSDYCRKCGTRLNTTDVDQQDETTQQNSDNSVE